MAAPLIKHDRLLVNFDSLKDHELVPAALKFLNLAHGHIGGTELIAFTKFVAKMPFEGSTALQSTMFDDTPIWGDPEEAATDYTIKKYSDLAKVNGAAVLDKQLFPILASCLEGSWVSLLDTVSKPLFCQAFAVLYATANKNSVAQKQSAISMLKDIQWRGTAEELSLEFVHASRALYNSGVQLSDIILHEFAHTVYQKNKIGGSAINDALLKHAALKASDSDTPDLNVYDFIKEHTALIGTNQIVQTRINLTETNVTDTRPPKCARCHRTHPNATADIHTTKCYAHTDAYGNSLPESTRTAVPPTRKSPQQVNMAKTMTKVETMLTQLNKQADKAARKKAKAAKPSKAVKFEANILEIVSEHAETTQRNDTEMQCNILEVVPATPTAPPH